VTVLLVLGLLLFSAAVGYAAGVAAYRRKMASYRPALAVCAGCWKPLFLDSWILMDEEGRLYCEPCARKEWLVAQPPAAVDPHAN
jgi:hypothetical protein